MTTVVMMVVQMMMLLLLLLLQVVMTVMLAAEAGVHRVPRTDDLRLRPMRQDVQDAEGLYATVVALPLPLVLLVRVLHLHHLQPLQRLEVIVRRTGGCRAVAAGPAVHFLLLLVLLLVVPERRNRIAALARPAAAPAVRHPVLITVAGVIPLLVLRYRIARIGSPRTQTFHVVLPGLVLRVGRHEHQRQRARTAHGDHVLVVLHVSSTRRAAARRPSVRRRAAHAAGRRRAGRSRCRRRHRIRFRHLRGTHTAGEEEEG